MTHEFEDFILLDWLDNKKWFDVKLLVDPSGGSFMKPMSNDSYAKAIKVILFALGIVALHLVHLGPNLRPKILEMLEEERATGFASLETGILACRIPATRQNCR
jgi:hypothetical protein